MYKRPIKKTTFVQFFEVGTKTIVECFVDYWNKADGKSITSPTNFSFYDYDRCYDLIIFLFFFKI